MIVSFDTETKGLDWFDKDQQAFLVSWTEDGVSKVGSTADPEVVADFRAAVARADRLVAHNLSFDVHQVRASMDIDLLATGKCVDTDLLARVVLPERATAADENGEGRNGYKLKDLAKTYLRADAQAAEETIDELAKAIGVKLKGENPTPGGYHEVWRAYPQEMEHYALLDAEYARDLLPILESKLTDKNAACWDIERRVAPVIIRAEQRGVAVDQEKVVPLKLEYERRAAELHDRLERELGEESLGGEGSRDALKEALLKAGVPLYKRTQKTGELATHKFALEEFEDKFPIVRDFLDYRSATKFLSTYLEPMSGRATVHPSFWQMGAWTGRMSCSRPNMQNIPVRAGSEVREVFVPRPDYCFVVCDYDSIELRLLAYYLNDEGFRQYIADGNDAFAWLAAKVYGGIKHHPLGTDPAQYVKGAPGEKLRGQCKNVTYATIYGAGFKKISDMIGESHEEGKIIVQAVKDNIPNYNKLASTRKNRGLPVGRVPRKIAMSGHVTTLMGRKQVVNRDKTYVGLNSLIQGSAADVFKLGTIAVDELVRPLGAHPVLFVHDELVVETPLEHAEEVLELTVKGMEEAYALTPALAVSGTIAYNSYAEGK